jgi:lipid II:glycine glycyltransferase (peptidoglycan interpeptide bridge formation enzyme)
MGSTIVLDLTQDIETLLSQMRATTRRYIRQGQRRGLTVREGGAGDLDAFAGLMKNLCLRRKVQPNIPQGNFLRELWNHFATRDCLRLFLAESEGEPISAVLVFTMGRWARLWRIGWSGSHRAVRPNELVYWEAIRWAKANGYRFFDLVGFDTRNAQALIEGRAVADADRCGMSAYKLGFGGQIERLSPGYCCFRNPLVQLGYKVIGRPLLEWRCFKYLTSRLAAQSQYE